jgi:ankyrin repeat protein
MAANDFFIITDDNLNQVDEHGKTALMSAVGAGWHHVVAFLLDRGADTSMVDKHCTTALMQACSLGLRTIVLQLLEHGADVDTTCSVTLEIKLVSLLRLRVNHR